MDADKTKFGSEQEFVETPVLLGFRVLAAIFADEARRLWKRVVASFHRPFGALSQSMAATT